MGRPQVKTDDVFIEVAGHRLSPLRSGALWLDSERILVVSDLHLEKGSYFAARGQMLPPYDTHATLTQLESLCQSLRPKRVISLGDSFHDRAAETRLTSETAERVRMLTRACDWVWVEGNHDPHPPLHLGGRAAGEERAGALVFRHEPTGETGEIAGHLHPAAKVRGRGRSVRRRCFVTDGDKLVMPALGAFTGGLNVLDAAFSALFAKGVVAFALGSDRVFALTGRQLVPDDRPASTWRL
ncbi:MAG: ligase-associated DNA damage response endonuclease PdeM [Pseudomonadota bacterium]